MLTHERLTEVMRQANATRAQIREALEHHRSETKRLEQQLQQVEGEFAMCVTLLRESAGSENFGEKGEAKDAKTCAAPVATDNADNADNEKAG